MRPAETHLTPQEFELLLFAASDSNADASNAGASEAQQHLNGCAACQSVAERYRKNEEKLKKLKSWLQESRRPNSSGRAGGSGRRPDCPEEQTWFSLAAGLLSDGESALHVSHAAGCDWCGPLLKEAMRVLALDTTQEEQESLAMLPTASPAWQREMARTLAAQNFAASQADATAALSPAAAAPTIATTAGTKAVDDQVEAAIADAENAESGPAVKKRPQPGQKKTGFSWWPKLAFAGAGLAVLAMVAWFAWQKTREPDVNQLLAQAYTEKRPFGMRFPGAKFAPVRKERGPNLDEPTSLLKAEIIIRENLAKTPHDPYWLQANGRALLLEGDPQNKAIDFFKQALSAHPDSSELLIDIGSAYLLRGDYAIAIDYLSHARMKTPDDPVALFNLALAYEQLFALNSAKEGWEQYLRIDSQGEWADEARRHLSEVQKKLDQKSKSLVEPLLTPKEIAQIRTNDTGFLEDIEARLEERIEEYQKTAITEWLPQAFPEFNLAGSSDALLALQRLADITKNRHEDEWLNDLLNGSKRSLPATAFKALAEAVKANERGDYSQGHSSSHLAAQLFRASANHAGEVRAQAEEVYSDHLLYEGEACLSLLQTMKGTLQQGRYTWLQAQMSLEESNCANWLGQYGTYHEAILRGKEQANRHHYIALYLRALGFQAQDSASLGDANAGFALACQGLKTFWSSKVDLMKGYNLYTDMDTAADGLRLPYLQVAIWKEATYLIDQHPDVLLRAMAHRWYANAAYLTNMQALAISEFENARSLFAKIPESDRDRIDAEIWLAQLETRQGDLDKAADRLKGIQLELAHAPNFVDEIRFYDTFAEIGMRRKNSVGTEQALASVISLAEFDLASRRSEEKRRQWTEQTQSTYHNLVEWKLQQGEPIAALELWEWYKGAYLRRSSESDPCWRKSHEHNVAFDFHNAHLPFPCPTAVSEQRLLMQDQTAVAYVLFRDGIAVWIYDDRGIFSQWIPTDVISARDLVSRFQRLCSERTSDIHTLQATARAVYDLLIAPIESRLATGRTVSFEPDGFLAEVPWGVLVDRRGHYFTESFPVVVSSGLYTTMHLRPPVPVTAETPALVVSIPDVPDGNMASLKEDVDAEAEAVASRFSAARTLEGDAATLDAIRQKLKDMGDNGIFHFAGHAVTSPARSGLVLTERDPRTGQGKLINAETLSVKPEDRLKLAGRLQIAVLSACHTTGEDQVGNSGTESLVEMLLHRGVPHIVASRWNVDSTETTEFMKLFYGRLLAGNDVSNSLQAAQLAMLSRPATAHPYYWSAFELQGMK